MKVSVSEEKTVSASSVSIQCESYSSEFAQKGDVGFIVKSLVTWHIQLQLGVFLVMASLPTMIYIHLTRPLFPGHSWEAE